MSRVCHNLWFLLTLALKPRACVMALIVPTWLKSWHPIGFQWGHIWVQYSIAKGSNIHVCVCVCVWEGFAYLHFYAARVRKSTSSRRWFYCACWHKCALTNTCSHFILVRQWHVVSLMPLELCGDIGGLARLRGCATKVHPNLNNVAVVNTTPWYCHPKLRNQSF